MLFSVKFVNQKENHNLGKDNVILLAHESVSTMMLSAMSLSRQTELNFSFRLGLRLVSSTPFD